MDKLWEVVRKYWMLIFLLAAYVLVGSLEYHWGVQP